MMSVFTNRFTNGKTGPKVFIYYGLRIAGHAGGDSVATSRNTRTTKKFVSLFGCSPEMAAEIWHCIKSNEGDNLRSGAQPFHLLWAFLFMKIYANECTLCAMVGGVDEKTFRNWTKYFIYLLSKILFRKEVLWKNRLKYDNGSLCKVSIDGTDFRIESGSKKKYWSHKFQAPGLRYEVGISIQSGFIVWVNGPFPCGQYPDIVIFRHRLKHVLKYCEEKVEADDGYRGENDYIELPSDHGGAGVTQIKAKQRVRSRHETCNKRFKQWSVLSQRFRHSDDIFHGHIFRAVVAITQMSIRTTQPLYQCSYRTIETETAKALRQRKLHLLQRHNINNP